MSNPLVVAIPVRNSDEELAPALNHVHLQDGEDAGEEEERSFEPSDFEVLQVLGAGNFSQVTLSRHMPTGDLFAVKEVKLESHEGDVVEKELEVLVTPRQNVIRFFGDYFEGSNMYLVLEYMDAGTLETIMKQYGGGTVVPLPEDVIASIASQILDGLIDLHDSRPSFLHRDIKPSNILVNLRGEAKLSDFNTSRALLSSMDKGKTFIVKNLPNEKPERIRGEEYTSAADIWALGLTLLECALGRYPYAVDGLLDNQMGFFKIMDKVVNKESPSAPDTFSKEFREFISICLKKDPAERQCARVLKTHPFIQKANGVAWLAEFLRPLYPSF